jgi:uncharacterized protein
MSKASVVNANPALSPAAPELPWYRQFWVWFVIAIPASSVVTGIILVTVAVKNADDLVLDEWYKEGRGTNRSMAAEILAADFGIGLAAVTTGIDQTVVQFHASRDMIWPEQMTLQLRHRTLADQDREYVLIHEQDGRYLLASHLPAGRWHVRVASEDVSWRLAGPTDISAAGELRMGTAQ